MRKVTNESIESKISTLESKKQSLQKDIDKLRATIESKFAELIGTNEAINQLKSLIEDDTEE